MPQSEGKYRSCLDFYAEFREQRIFFQQFQHLFKMVSKLHQNTWKYIGSGFTKNFSTLTKSYLILVVSWWPESFQFFLLTKRLKRHFQALIDFLEVPPQFLSPLLKDISFSKKDCHWAQIKLQNNFVMSQKIINKSFLGYSLWIETQHLKNIYRLYVINKTQRCEGFGKERILSCQYFQKGFEARRGCDILKKQVWLEIL